MGIPKAPEVGDPHIDASELQNLVKYPTEHINTLTKLRDGFGKAVDCLVKLTPAQRKAAGIGVEAITELVELTAEHKQLNTFHEASVDLTLRLHHTHLDRGHKIATRLAEATEQIQRRADRDVNGAEILGSITDLLEYQLGPALKAAATRAKEKAGPSKDDEGKGDEPVVKGDSHVTK